MQTCSHTNHTVEIVGKHGVIFPVELCITACNVFRTLSNFLQILRTDNCRFTYTCFEHGDTIRNNRGQISHVTKL